MQGPVLGNNKISQSKFPLFLYSHYKIAKTINNYNEELKASKSGNNYQPVNKLSDRKIVNMVAHVWLTFSRMSHMLMHS